MYSAPGAKGMKTEGARSVESGRRRTDDFLGKEDSPSRSASRWHRSICCSFFFSLFFFHYAKLSTARISLSLRARPFFSPNGCLSPIVLSVSRCVFLHPAHPSPSAFRRNFSTPRDPAACTHNATGRAIRNGSSSQRR